MKPLLTLVPVLAFAPASIAQETAVYPHPAAAISIEAPAGWADGPWAGDPGVYEVAAPDGSLRILLWFTATEQSARRYLLKMIGMKPLDPEGDPTPLEISGQEAWSVFATGAEQGDENVRELLAAIPAPEGSAVEGNFIVQIWCPADTGAGPDPEMEELLATVRVAALP